jgi:hypothetical protein
MALPDMPKQHRLADAVIGGLRKSAGTRDGTAAIVKPVAGDMPGGNLSHRTFSCSRNNTLALGVRTSGDVLADGHRRGDQELRQGSASFSSSR